MLKIRYQTSFKKDIKRIQKRGYDISLMKPVIDALAAQQELDEKYHDHALSGDWRRFRECHITPDWLLIYKQTETELLLVRTGTHSDLFR